MELQAKQLAARSEYLDEREDLLKTGPLDLTVLEETLRARNNQIKQLQDRKTEAEVAYRERMKILSASVAARKQLLAAASDKLANLDSEIAAAEKRLKQVEAERKQAEAETAERQKYLAEQEKVIDESIDSGNATLRGIDYEIQTAHESLDVIKQEIAAAETTKTQVAFDLIQLSDRHKQEVYQCEQELERLRHKIDEANRELTQTQTNGKMTSTAVEEKLRQLSIKEQELMTQKGALRRERLELENDKRRWNSTKSLYGDTI